MPVPTLRPRLVFIAIWNVPRLARTNHEVIVSHAALRVEYIPLTWERPPNKLVIPLRDGF
jgi:hypothetical protein